MRVQMIKARFAACIADGLQTVRAEVSMWACASGPRRRSTGERDLALLTINLVPERVRVSQSQKNGGRHQCSLRSARASSPSQGPTRKK